MKRPAKKIHNLKRRYSIISIAVIVVCISVFSVLQYLYMDDIFLIAKKQDMKEVAAQIADFDPNDESALSAIADMESAHNLYIEIYSPREKLVYTSRSNEAVYDKISGTTSRIEMKPRIMKIISRSEQSDGNYFEVRQEYFATAQYIVYGAFIGDDTVVELYTSIDVIKDNAETASEALLALSAFILVTIFTVTAYYLTLFTNPIRKITKTTKKMATLDFSESCPPFRIKELNELSENINILSGRLDKALTELKKENRQLESDIRLERKLEKTRRSFIANVSHELKTPISIIQGYAEGLKYGIGCDNKDEYCDIIIEESQKMNNLVVRIMEYMLYGSGNLELKNESFSVNSLIKDYLSTVENSDLTNDAEVTIRIDPAFTGYGDKELIRHVFSNYFTNALNHLDFERKITVNARDMGEYYRVTVFNTGKPIPGSDIENIWQSFYRADKAHSRQEGRFGLGLSIVASIQELHNQKYGVSNKDGGVEFYFDIKKAEAAEKN